MCPDPKKEGPFTRQDEFAREGLSHQVQELCPSGPAERNQAESEETLPCSLPDCDRCDSETEETTLSLIILAKQKTKATKDYPTALLQGKEWCCQHLLGKSIPLHLWVAYVRTASLSAWRAVWVTGWVTFLQEV